MLIHKAATKNSIEVRLWLSGLLALFLCPQSSKLAISLPNSLNEAKPPLSYLYYKSLPSLQGKQSTY